MTKSFSECADDMSQRSKNINFYENIVAMVRHEKRIKGSDDPYHLRGTYSDSETAYFNSSGQS